LSTREIAAELNIGDRSVRRIAKKDLHLNAFRRVPVQVLNAGTKQKQLERATALLCRLKVRDSKHFLHQRENFYLNPPVSNENNRVWVGGKTADVFSLSVRSLRSML